MIRAICLLLFLIPSSALGETVRVRSGEHESFSRLVFDFDQPTEWALQRNAEGFDLQFSRSDIRFDLSQVFRFIPRTRLRDIAAQPGEARLLLRVDCTCHANAFKIGANRLVVDVTDGPSPEDRDANDIGPTHQSASAATQEVFRLPRVPVIGDFPVGPGSEVAKPDRHFAPIPSGESRIETSLPGTAGLNEMKMVLLKELGRAVAQGLIEADIDPPPAVRPAPLPPADIDLPAPPTIPRNLAVGLRIETSIDRANPASNRPAGKASGRSCLPASIFDLSGKQAGTPAGMLIGEARSNLLGEFDDVDPKDLKDMVKAYLYLGFGAEAQALMTAFAADLPHAAFFRAMAQVLDDGQAADPAIFDGQIGCSAPVALWAAMARPELPGGADIDRRAIVSAFSSLPLHLRRHLGPGLAERFLAIKDLETAARIRNALARAGARGGARLLYMQAKHDLATGNRAAALSKLRQVMADDQNLAPAALLTIIESQLEAGQRPEPQDVTTAEAFAREYRGTEKGARFRRAAILAHARNGHFAAAFEGLARIKAGVSPALRRRVVTILTEDGSDAAFLRHAFAMAQDDARPDGLSRKMAARLLALGFPRRASMLLPAPASAESMEMSVLRARLALYEGRPAATLSFLEGLSGHEVERMRGAALSQLGNSPSALKSFAAAGAVDEQKAMAWKAGDWRLVLRHGSAAQKEFAKLQRNKSRLKSAPQAAEDAPSLSRVRMLLEHSRSARDVLGDLLSADADAESP